MDTQWKPLLISILLVTSNICQIFGQNFGDESADFEEFELPDTATYTDNLQKRLSKFVRIGRGLSSFIRIGRHVPFGELDFYQTQNFPNAINNENGDNENSAFYEMEPENTVNIPSKRLSSFVRIGRNYNHGDVLTDNDISKRSGAFIRMGKFPSSAFLRNRPGRVDGYKTQPYYRRTGRIGHSSFIRIGKRDTSDALRRMSENKNQLETIDMVQKLQNSPSNSNFDTIENTDERRYLKIGRNVESYPNENDKKEDTESNNYLKLGADVDNISDEKDKDIQPVSEAQNNSGENSDDLQKRISSFVRIGRQQNLADDVTKRRVSSFVRIGKKSDEIGPNLESSFSEIWVPDLDNKNEDKRISSFVRIGKSPKQFEKRYSSFVRIGKSGDDLENDLAKRYSSFVRIGKSKNDLVNDFAKRYSSFVRIGKDGNDFDNGFPKRYSSFVRIGRNLPVSDKDINKRLSSFIRVGKNIPGIDSEYNKRYSSFVRIGKDSPSIRNEANKRYSSFVRIGKNGDDLRPSFDKKLSSFIRVGKDVNDVEKYTDQSQLDDSFGDETRIIEKRSLNKKEIGKTLHM